MSITFKPLVWGPVCEPNEECRYNHCEAQTPFGRFLLTWKGWKDGDAICAEESPWHDWLGGWDTLEDAKAACEQLWRERLMLCVQGDIVSASNLRPAVIAQRKAVWLARIKDHHFGARFYTNRCEWMRRIAEAEPTRTALVSEDVTFAEEHAALKEAIEESLNDPRNPIRIGQES